MPTRRERKEGRRRHCSHPYDEPYDYASRKNIDGNSRASNVLEKTPV